MGGGVGSGNGSGAGPGTGAGAGVGSGSVGGTESCSMKTRMRSIPSCRVFVEMRLMCHTLDAASLHLCGLAAGPHRVDLGAEKGQQRAQVDPGQ